MMKHLEVLDNYNDLTTLKFTYSEGNVNTISIFVRVNIRRSGTEH